MRLHFKNKAWVIVISSNLSKTGVIETRYFESLDSAICFVSAYSR